MAAMPPYAMGGMDADMMAAMPPTAMEGMGRNDGSNASRCHGGMDADMMAAMPPAAMEGMGPDMMARCQMHGRMAE